MKNKILQKFLDSDIIITNKELLIKYIDFCIKQNLKKRIFNGKGFSKTSHHHILPRSLFNEYSNLTNNPWNGSHLLFSDHYYAHWLLTESLNDYGQLSAFCAMHNMDKKNGRITERDLIPKDEFQKKMEERNEGISDWRKNNLNKVNEAIKKSLITLNTPDKYGVTIRQKATLKMKETKNKYSIKRKKEISDKRLASLGEEGLKDISMKSSITQRNKSSWFDLYHIDKGLIEENIPYAELRKISQALNKTDKINYLGKTKRSKQQHIIHGKEHLIGLYVVIISYPHILL